MGENITQKIIKSHLVSGKMIPGEEIGIKIDQTLTQDATGTMAYLQFEALEIPHVKTELSVSYVDHNTLQSGFENADDHRYLRTAAARYGIHFSRPGTGICHQVHVENFGIPGKTLLGSDSHTPTGGALGMIAIGAGGLDVAVAMGGGAFYLPAPEVAAVELTGEMPPWVGAKDVILELLSSLTVKGGVGKVFEYCGPGAASLSITERATITNMGAELGATTSIFPSDDTTLRWMQSQNRADNWLKLSADADADYDQYITIDLSALQPLAACPHSPDNVKKVKELTDIKLQQVCIGSCTNSSLADMLLVAEILKNKKVHPELDLVISPGSSQVLKMMSDCGALSTIVSAGGRILECACGPCIGMGQSPVSQGNTLRTFNRNFKGRSGTADANIYLAGPAVAAASALSGHITDPRELGEMPPISLPGSYPSTANIARPASKNEKVQVVRGPNIKPCPLGEPVPENYRGEILLKVEDNITTDDIMPAGAKVLPLRSNIPAISEHVYEPIDPEFAARAKQAGGGVIIGGENYGQGSSREHAALAPMYLGIRAVVSKSFARIHHANLVNFGIIPLTFANPTDYDTVTQGEKLTFTGLRKQLETGKQVTAARGNGITIKLNYSLSPRQIQVLLAGGLLNYTKNQE